MFSPGFIEILAAEQTPDSSDWFQGTADAVRQAARHFVEYEADYYLILAGDHLYRMDFAELVRAHIDTHADITIAAQPVTVDDASSMGIYVFSRHILLDLIRSHPGVDFGREIIPSALTRLRVRPFFHGGYWADVGTVKSFYDVNILLTQRGAPFNFFHPRRPIYSHPRFLPGSKIYDSTIDDAIVTEGCYLEHCQVRESVVGIRTRIGHGAVVRRSVLLGADFYDDGAPSALAVPLGIGQDVQLDTVIVDKNARIGDGARLVNERGLAEADGAGYSIRDGIIVVPKGAVIAPGTVI